MRRPLPIHVRGPRRARVRRPTVLLGIPRISPEYELAALTVLMKPKEHTKGAIKHRSGGQPWPPAARDRVERAREKLCDALGFETPVEFPKEGDYWMIAEVPRELLEAAKAFAILLSRELPGTWLALDRLFIRDGLFFRRAMGHRLYLVPASNVHLTRAARAAIGFHRQPAGKALSGCNSNGDGGEVAGRSNAKKPSSRRPPGMRENHSGLKAKTGTEIDFSEDQTSRGQARRSRQESEKVSAG